MKALLLVSSVAALQAPHCTLPRRPATRLAAQTFVELAEQSSLPPADKSRITVLSDADAVGAEVWKRIDAAGKRAVKERGTFTLAIPGGSVLKMLAGTKPAWAEDCLLAYVNHKAVNDDDDAALSTHAKAKAGFLDAGWDGVDVLNLGGSSDAVAEACRSAAERTSFRQPPRRRLTVDSTQVCGIAGISDAAEPATGRCDVERRDDTRVRHDGYWCW